VMSTKLKLLIVIVAIAAVYKLAVSDSA
jgi:hypothetical protein